MTASRPVVLLVATLAGAVQWGCRRPSAPPVAPRADHSGTDADSGEDADLAPGRAGVAQASARRHLRDGRLAEAAQGLAEALRLDPSHASLHRDLGEVHARARDFPAALRATQEALRLDPGSASAWVQLGSIHYARRDHRLAETAFLRAAEIAPGRADVHDWLGSARFAQHVAALGGDNVDRARVELAVASFRRAAELAPSDPDYRLRLALALRKLHDLPGAERELREAVRLGGRAECSMHLAETLLEQGRLEEAEAELQRALAASPRMTRALVGLGRLRLTQGDAEGARELLSRAVGIDPGHAEARFVLAQALVRLGMDGEAQLHQLEYARLHAVTEDLRTAAQAVSLRPDDARSHEALGRLRESSGDLPGAAEAYGRAIELDPGSIAARVNLAGMLLDAGRPGDALPHLKAAVQSDPGNAQALVNLGFALEQLGDPAGAVAAYERAKGLEPGDESITRRLDRARTQVAGAARP